MVSKGFDAEMSQVNCKARPCSTEEETCLYPEEHTFPSLRLLTFKQIPTALTKHWYDGVCPFCPNSHIAALISNVTLIEDKAWQLGHTDETLSQLGWCLYIKRKEPCENTERCYSF